MLAFPARFPTIGFMKAFLALWIAGIGTCCAWPYLKTLPVISNPVVAAIVQDFKGLTTPNTPPRSIAVPSPADEKVLASQASQPLDGIDRSPLDGIEQSAVDGVQQAMLAQEVHNALGEPVHVVRSESRAATWSETWYYPTAIIYFVDGRVRRTHCVATPASSRAGVSVLAGNAAGNWSVAPANVTAGSFARSPLGAGNAFVGRSTSLNTTLRIGSLNNTSPRTVGSSTGSNPAPGVVSNSTSFNAAPRVSYNGGSSVSVSSRPVSVVTAAPRSAAAPASASASSSSQRTVILAR